MPAPRLTCRRSFACSALAVSLWCIAGFAASGGAQTLARPGWTGSGITTEPWWRSAVFYRIVPERFQDSDGDGVGDLRGVAERLDYLQALGVDAVVLQLPFDDAGFDELLTEASRRHIRLVIGLDRAETERDGKDAAANTPSGVPLWQARLQGRARQWLSRGAGGILLPPAPGSTAQAQAAEEGALRRSLCRIVAAYAGERIVIVSSLAMPSAASGPQRLHLASRTLPQDGPQLIVRSISLPGEAGDPAAEVSTALLQEAPDDGAPLLELNTTADAISGNRAAGIGEVTAATLLTQPAAVLLEYGQEIGVPAPQRMPWTPTNVTQPAEPEPQADKLATEKAANGKPANEKPANEKAAISAPPVPMVYGPYRPYVPPPPPKARAPLANNNEPLPPDPDTLPGFSTELPPPSLPGEKPSSIVSVALQERDPRSLLTLYRRLSALHHGNASLRRGSLTLVQESQGAIVWLRQAPATARTAASVLVAVNPGSQAVTLSLSSDFARLHLRAGELRSLLPGITGPEVLSSARLTLPAHGIFLGELTHGR